jgi:homoserine dehydrogenase
VALAELIPESTATHASVQPALVPEPSALGRVDGSQNIVVVDGEFGGETAFAGFGAGGEPTAVAVVSDVIAISKDGALLSEGWLPTDEAPSRVITEFEAAHYVRFTVADRPGVIADLSRIFSKHRINVDAVLQEPGWSKSELPFVMTLERCPSSTLKEALIEIEQLDFHVRPPLWLPVLAKGEKVS